MFPFGRRSIFVVKPIDNPLALYLQLRVHCVNIRFPQWICGQIDLSQHVET